MHSKHISALKDESSWVKYKLEKLENEKSKTTLIIDTVNEVDGEIMSTTVDRVLADLQVGFTSSD